MLDEVLLQSFKKDTKYWTKFFLPIPLPLSLKRRNRQKSLRSHGINPRRTELGVVSEFTSNVVVTF